MKTVQNFTLQQTATNMQQNQNNLQQLATNKSNTTTNLQQSATTHLTADAIELAKHYRAANTTTAYKKHIKYFALWCASQGIAFSVQTTDDSYTDIQGLYEITPIVVCNYISYLVANNKSSSTIVATIAAINNLTSPFDYEPAKTHAVKVMVQSAKRKLGTAPKKAKAVRSSEIVLNLSTIEQAYNNDAQKLRNKALLLLGFAGAFRRSELVAVKVSDLDFVSGAMLVNVAKSKTDQLGKGRQKPIKASKTKQACPIAAVRAWIDFAGLGKDDFLFPSIHKSGKVQTKALNGKDVSLIVKTVLGNNYSSHGLRSGFITEAFERGYDVKVIQGTTLQKTDSVTTSYRQIQDTLSCAIDAF